MGLCEFKSSQVYTGSARSDSAYTSETLSQRKYRIFLILFGGFFLNLFIYHA